MRSDDLIQYWVHRVLHTVPWLWKFHAVHHSTAAMGWLAGSRLWFDGRIGAGYYADGFWVLDKRWWGSSVNLPNENL